MGTKPVEDGALFSDSEVKGEMARVSAAIEGWARSRDLWHDCGFKTWFEHNNDEPVGESPLMLMWGEGSMYQVWNGGLDEEEGSFRALLESLGYWYENQDGVSIHIYPMDEARGQVLTAYSRWQWLKSLVRADFSDVHAELYDHFSKYPKDLLRLKHRDFEVLLSRIFAAKGFEAELGPGSGDGGVDIKLWYRDPIGDVLTYVQAKRYAEKYPIKLEAVSALSGVVHTFGANRGIFVTTSRYLPSAMEFAAAERSKVELKDSSDVAEWCRGASIRVLAGRATLVSRPQVERLLNELRMRPDHRLLHGTRWSSHNSFAVVLKETKHAALIMILGKVQPLDGQPKPLQGYDMPDLKAPVEWPIPEEMIFRATRTEDAHGQVSYWGGGTLYFPWDGQPQVYDMMD